MKKIMLLVFAAYISLFAVDKENLLGDHSKATREFKEYSLASIGLDCDYPKERLKK